MIKKKNGAITSIVSYLLSGLQIRSQDSTCRQMVYKYRGSQILPFKSIGFSSEHIFPQKYFISGVQIPRLIPKINLNFKLEIETIYTKVRKHCYYNLKYYMQQKCRFKKIVARTLGSLIFRFGVPRQPLRGKSINSLVHISQ